MFMLDTDTCIYIKKHKPPQVLKKFQLLSPAEVCMSAITFAELMNGALKSQLVEHNLAKLKKILKKLRQIIRVEPFDEKAAEKYGQIRSTLERKGVVIGSNDLLIAAHALSLHKTLVTNNEREFSRVEGLLIVNWVNANC
jgi:tRNA(fMet)-specific endonuclease VapC